MAKKYSDKQLKKYFDCKSKVIQAGGTIGLAVKAFMNPEFDYVSGDHGISQSYPALRKYFAAAAVGGAIASIADYFEEECYTIYLSGKSTETTDNY